MLKALAAGMAALYLGPALMAVPAITALVTERRNPAQRNHVALTFDDGPHPDGTPAVLEILAANDVRATFFLVAEQVARHPQIARQVVVQGHDIAVHGLHHRPLLLENPLAAMRSIGRARDLISEATGVTPHWYRPPYGLATGPILMAVAHCGLTPVWWTREGRDWSARSSPGGVATRILSRRGGREAAMNGRDVLLLHDSDAYATPGSWRTTVAALPAIIDGVRRTGYTLGPLPPRSRLRPDESFHQQRP